jgi:hypothetical protein
MNHVTGKRGDSTLDGSVGGNTMMNLKLCRKANKRGNCPKDNVTRK